MITTEAGLVIDATADAEEIGRRLRALFAALHRVDEMHAVTLGRYRAGLNEIQEAESVAPDVEGSWGWWAQRILSGEPS